jgi:hypothetical protein
VVVVVGFRVTVPVAEVDEKTPGETATLVAPDVVQVRVVLVPAVMVCGLAENAVMAGIATCGMVGNGVVQPDNSAAMTNRRTTARISTSDRLSSRTPDFLQLSCTVEFMRTLPPRALRHRLNASF